MPVSWRPVGRCPVLFLLAVTFDALGIALILTGIFANLQKDGRGFGEFLIYSGGILVFFSLLWWLFWYSFNLEVSIEDLVKDSLGSPRRNNLVQLARKFSERFSARSRRKVSTRDTLAVGQASIPNLPGEPLHLTPAAFINNGFVSQVDFPTPIPEQRHLELSTVSSLQGEPEGEQVMEDRLV